MKQKKSFISKKKYYWKYRCTITGRFISTAQYLALPMSQTIAHKVKKP